MTQNRPLVYYWIAQYDDGTCLPQYNPITYLENRFSDIEQDKLIKFGLYPFDKELAEGITKKGIDPVVSIPFLPKYEINLDNDRRLIHYRDVFISHEEYHLCRKCGKEFEFSSTSPKTNSKYSSPICPNCNSHDLFICKSCGKEYQRFEDAKFGMCDCKGHLKRERFTSGQYSREKRWIEYFLGYQTKVKGNNYKTLLKIDERGDSIIT